LTELVLTKSKTPPLYRGGVCFFNLHYLQADWQPPQDDCSGHDCIGQSAFFCSGVMLPAAAIAKTTSVARARTRLRMDDHLLSRYDMTISKRTMLNVRNAEISNQERRDQDGNVLADKRRACFRFG